jgi:NADH-quinone oxidoreductase subunit M
VTVHLSILLLWPLAAAVLTALLPRALSTLMALVGALVPLGYAVVLLLDFDHGAEGLQYVTSDAWIDDLGIRYELGVDGLNLWLIALTAVLFAAAALWVNLRPPLAGRRLFTFHMGLAESAVLGALMAQDLALFVLFFDLMLVPIYFLVGQWGGVNRVAATLKLVIYTLVGSLLMLAAAVATAVLADEETGRGLTFSLAELRQIPLAEGTQKWLFAGFALAFLIKMPIFPLHGWMPDGYRAMPLPVLVFFSGVVSKVAAYGFLRIALPVFPEAANDFQTIFYVLALLSILYGSAQAFTQTNARLILGYSSMAQLGFVVLGIFSLQDAGGQGAVLQMVNHGLVVAPLFLIVVLLAERTGSEDIREMGGVAFRAPVLAALFLVAALATLAIPGSANFVGEFLILFGVFEESIAVAVIASIGVALASVYMLRMFIRSMHNRTAPNVVSRDLRPRDALVLAPLVAAIVAFGLYPQAALEDSERSVQETLQAARAPSGEQAAGTVAEVAP